MSGPDPVDLPELRRQLEWCRKCRDEMPYGAPAVRAEFIPWGRLFGRDELVGPCCEKHLPKSVDLGRIDQYAVTDLRPVLALLDRIDALEAVDAIDAAHLAHQREWSTATFGPGRRTLGVINHIRKELKEIEADPTDLVEWVDVVMLAFDGAWRAGWEPQQIIDAVKAKQARNEARTWPDWRTLSEDVAIEHDRRSPDPGPVAGEPESEEANGG